MEKRIFESFKLIDCVSVECGEYREMSHISMYVWDCYYTSGIPFSKPIKMRVTTYEPAPLKLEEAAKHVPQSFTGFTNGTGFLYIIEEYKPMPAPAHYRVVNKVSIKEPYPVQDCTSI